VIDVKEHQAPPSPLSVVASDGYVEPADFLERIGVNVRDMVNEPLDQAGITTSMKNGCDRPSVALSMMETVIDSNAPSEAMEESHGLCDPGSLLSFSGNISPKEDACLSSSLLEAAVEPVPSSSSSSAYKDTRRRYDVSGFRYWDSNYLNTGRKRYKDEATNVYWVRQADGSYRITADGSLDPHPCEASEILNETSYRELEPSSALSAAGSVKNARDPEPVLQGNRVCLGEASRTGSKDSISSSCIATETLCLLSQLGIGEDARPQSGLSMKGSIVESDGSDAVLLGVEALVSPAMSRVGSDSNESFAYDSLVYGMAERLTALELPQLECSGTASEAQTEAMISDASNLTPMELSF